MILLFCRLLFVNNRILFSLFALVLFPLRDDKAPPIVRFPEDEEEATALELLLLFAETIQTVVIVVVGIVLFTRSFSDSKRRAYYATVERVLSGFHGPSFFFLSS